MLLGTSSCSLILPADAVQCETAEDCLARGFPTATICQQQICATPPVDPVWGCLGNVEEPMAMPGTFHNQTMLIVDALTGVSPPGLTLRICSSVDINCDSPLEENLTPDAGGYVHFTVMSGFLGYLETDAPDIMPSILPIGPVVDDSPETGETIQLVRTIVVEAIAGTAGIEIDPTKGHVLSLLGGCDGLGHAGVSFTHQPSDQGTPFYLIGNSPDTMVPVSDESGQSGILNVEPSFVTISTTREETGQFIGEKRVLIRPGHLTYAGILPTPI